MKSVLNARSTMRSLLVLATQTALVAGLAAQVCPSALADENPFAGDVWSATDLNRGPEVEILSYEDVMSLTADDRRVYILGLQRMLDFALLEQNSLSYAPTNFAQNESVQIYKNALSLLQGFVPAAEAAPAPSAESEEEHTAKLEVDRLTLLTSTANGHVCDPVNGDPVGCKGFQDDLADAQKALAQKTADRKAGKSGDSAAADLDLVRMQKVYDRSGCAKPENETKPECIGAKSELDAVKKKAQVETHPPIPHADVQAQKDADAVAKKKADAVKDTIAAEHGKCADFTNDDTAYKKCQSDADVKVKAAQADADRAKLEANKAALKLLQDTGDKDKVAEMRAKLQLGKGCSADQPAAKCTAPGKDSVDAKKRQEAINTYNSKLKSSAQCTAGFLPSASTGGSCLSVHSLRMGDKNFVCGADTTMCNPWEYGAKKIGDSFDALCAKVPTSGTAKAKSLIVGGACETLSSQSSTVRDEFLKAPINGVKEGWESNVRKPLQTMCGGPLRMKANCEVCNRMAADAQVAISATGHITKCDGSDNPAASKKRGKTAQ